MTSAQLMLGPRACFVAMLTLLSVVTGCKQRDRLDPPAATIAPYDTVFGDPVWAVVPLRNESGVSFLDAGRISDDVVAAAAQVRGVSALPLNRTIAKMRELGMQSPRSPDDAMVLANALGADAIIVGSITAYDPYKPLLGLALALYPTPRGRIAGPEPIDINPRVLISRPTEYRYFRETPETRDEPGSVISGYYDGENHGVISEVQTYAQGRQDPDDRVLGWRRYLASMQLYSEFAADRAVGELVQREWLRMERASRAGGPVRR